VKGHVLRLRGARLLERIVRATVLGRSIYLVPRDDGELVVGASVEERGFDLRVQAGEVHRLLDDARRVVPGIDELELGDVSTGLRPGAPDNAPSIELLDEGRTVLACGHHRNGVLLAPLTAELVLALLDGRGHPALELVDRSHHEASR
jgi:glycine oxidase